MYVLQYSAVPISEAVVNVKRIFSTIFILFNYLPKRGSIKQYLF